MLGNKVVWSEGLFLRQHHLQQQERYFERLVRERAQACGPYSWGVSELSLDQGLLGLGQFAINRCRGVFEDGTPFSLPDDDRLPLPLALPETVRDKIIYLALPVLQRGGLEVGPEDSPSLTRFVPEAVEVQDANDGSPIPAEMQVGRLRLRYLIEGSDTSGHLLIGLGRVIEVRSERGIVLDDRYAPPALDCRAVSALSNLLIDMQGLITHRASALALRVAGGDGRGVGEIAEFLLLQILNRYEPLLAHLNSIPLVHPERLYSIAVMFAGELATIASTAKRPPTFPGYRHDDLQGSFAPVLAELRRSLSTVLEQTAIQIPLVERKYGIRTGQIADRSLITSATFVLSVKAAVPVQTLMRAFPAQVKVGPVEQIRELVNVALPGIPVRPLPVAPRQLPFHAGSTYFELERSNPLWQRMAPTGGIALHVAGEFPQLEIDLWAIRG